VKKTLLIVTGIILLIVILGISSVAGSYNKLITLQEGVEEKWAQVENVYQRRLDLIPNLVATVKGYAEHEKQTLTEVVEARTKALQTKIDVSSLSNEGKFAAFTKAQEGLSSALSRLLVVVEKYPDLKANQNFLSLQSQLEGTENRIAVERRRYNETVRRYNTTIKRFPVNMLASAFGFKKNAYFKAAKEAETVPKVEF